MHDGELLDRRRSTEDARVRRYSAYLFNLNGTLVRARSDTAGGASAGRGTGSRSDAEVSLALRLSTTSAAAELYSFRRDGRRWQMWQTGPVTPADLEPIDGVLHSLHILHKHGKFVGVYTTRDAEFLRCCLAGPLAREKDCIGFSVSLIDARLLPGSGSVVAMMRAGYRRERGPAAGYEPILMVGDALTDLEAARSAGVDFAGVLTGNATKDDFLREGLSEAMIFPSIKEVLRPPARHGVVALIRNEHNQLLLVQEARPDHPYHGRWAGPHGVCEGRDVVEEETVVREAQEECGVAVKPVQKLFHCRADTKVRTVSFWEARLANPPAVPRADGCEASCAEWVSVEELLRGERELYDGMREFIAGQGRDWLAGTSKN